MRSRNNRLRGSRQCDQRIEHHGILSVVSLVGASEAVDAPDDSKPHESFEDCAARFQALLSFRLT